MTALTSCAFFPITNLPFSLYPTLVSGDWFIATFIAHTGDVYLNEKSMYEVTTLDKVKNPQKSTISWDPDFSVYTWYAEQDEANNQTIIYANFHEKDPNKENVEISVRRNCFYPESDTNFVFRSVMSREMGEMDYGDDEQLYFGAEAAYPPRPGMEPELHFISVENTQEESFDRTEMEARFTARRIRQLLDEKFQVQGEDGRPRPVEPEGRFSLDPPPQTQYGRS